MNARRPKVKRLRDPCLRRENTRNKIKSIQGVTYKNVDPN